MRGIKQICFLTIYIIKRQTDLIAQVLQEGIDLSYILNVDPGMEIYRTSTNIYGDHKISQSEYIGQLWKSYHNYVVGCKALKMRSGVAGKFLTQTPAAS